MSHELAALLLTTTIQNSRLEKKPLFVLLLDAKSAFDRVLREILVRRLFLDTEKDQRISYWNLRLGNRLTYCHWDGLLMGPIHDELGVEQGGPNSSDHYKIYNNEQLAVAQESGLGSLVGEDLVAAVGQADDCVLLFLMISTNYSSFSTLLSTTATSIRLSWLPERLNYCSSMARIPTTPPTTSWSPLSTLALQILSLLALPSMLV